MKYQHSFVWLILAAFLASCDPTVTQDEATSRMAQIVRGIANSSFTFDDPNASAGPLTTMCAAAYTPITGCQVKCDPADSGTGVFTRLIFTCNSPFNTDSHLPESRCWGQWQAGQLESPDQTTVTVDPVTRLVKLIWGLKGDIYKWPGWGQKLWIGGTMTFEVRNNVNSRDIVFKCTSESSVMPNMQPVDCSVFEPQVNVPCNNP